MKTIKKRALEVELTASATAFVRDAYDIELEIPIKINSRLTSTLGRFRYYATRDKKSPLVIELSKKFIEYGEVDQIISTLKHECIHYALYMLDKPHHDGDACFENELKKHESHSTRTQAVTMKTYVYTCGCNEFKSLTKRDLSDYQCKTCKNRLKFSHVNEPTPLRKVI